METFVLRNTLMGNRNFTYKKAPQAPLVYETSNIQILFEKPRPQQLAIFTTVV